MAVIIDSNTKKFLFHSETMSYGFGVDANGRLKNLHWGATMDSLNDLPDASEISFHTLMHYQNRADSSRYEYSGYCRGYLYEPGLKVKTPDEFGQSDLRYSGFRQLAPNHLAVELQPIVGEYSIRLHYRQEEPYGLLSRWAEIRNMGNRAIVFENLFSAAWVLPRNRHWRLTRLYGTWGQEYRVNHETVEPGERVFESRTGLSGHMETPFFALDEGQSDERGGEIYFGTLLWSGNWKFIAELDPYGEMRVSGGWNNFDFEYELHSGESVSTPVFLAGFTAGGFGEMSRMLHRYQQQEIYPENMRKKTMPTIFNTYSCIRNEQVTEQNVLALIPQAAAVGIELFIIDAGWQTEMGDWQIHPKKFPGGFRKIIDSVHACGMKFGLWLEFERLDATSQTYQNHPDWLIDSERYTLLNFAMDEVRDYVHDLIYNLLKGNDISYFKMDLNRYLEIPECKDRRRMRTRYMQNFYAMLSRLMTEFPNVFWENCASGSGRPDMEIDRYFARINRSDNQDTLDVLDIHEGFTYLHPSKMAGGGCQISHSYSYFVNHRKIPLQFMAHTAMMGWLSLGIPLDRSPQTELDACAQYIRQYKRFRHIVAFGELYRIAAYRQTHAYAAFEFVLPDRSEALLFLFGHGLRYGQTFPELRLGGLKEDAMYVITRYGDPELTTKEEQFCYVPEPKPQPKSGMFLMNHGLQATLNGDLDSRLFHFQQQKSRYIP